MHFNTDRNSNGKLSRDYYQKDTNQTAQPASPTNGQDQARARMKLNH